MIDKILNAFPSYLGDVIPKLDYQGGINPHLPSPIEYLTIANVKVPLFGGILAGEMRLLEKLLELQASVYTGLTTVMKLIGADEYTSIPDIHRALKIGSFQTYKYSTAKINWNKIGQPELAKIAEKQGVTIFTTTATEDDRSVQDVVEKYYDAWVEAGFNQESGLAAANAVLNKQAPISRELGELVTFDADDVLKQAGLSWQEVDAIEDLVNPDISYLLILKFRVGIGQFNIFDYVPYRERAGIIDALKGELANKDISNPVVASNANIEVENTSSAGGDENLG
jgi:hypothetical protein